MNQAQSLISLVLLVYVTASTPIFEFTGLDDYSPGILAKDQQPGEKISFNWQRTEVYEILYVGNPKRDLSLTKEYRVDIGPFTSRYGGRHWRAKRYNHFRKPDMPPVIMALLVIATINLPRQYWALPMPYTSHLLPLFRQSRCPL